MEIKINDRVQTPNGPGKVISMIAKNPYYTVMHDSGQSGLYHKKDIQVLTQQVNANGK